MSGLSKELELIIDESWKRQGKTLYESHIRVTKLLERLGDIYADFAAALGLEADQLTDLQKQQAVLGYILGD